MPARLLRLQGVLVCRTSALTAFACSLVRQAEIRPCTRSLWRPGRRQEPAAPRGAAATNGHQPRKGTLRMAHSISRTEQLDPRTLLVDVNVRTDVQLHKQFGAGQSIAEEDDTARLRRPGVGVLADAGAWFGDFRLCVPVLRRWHRRSRDRRDSGFGRGVHGG